MDIQTRSTAMGKALKLLLWLVVLLGGAAHANTVTYVYTDPQGTPLAEADASGTITATFDYAPYGSQALGTAPSGPGYTGHVNDPDTGLVYMQARYYDPVVGRFLSVDPVGPTTGNVFNFNRFGYANNNPIVNMDLDGRETGRLTNPDGVGVAGPGYVTFVNPSSSEGGIPKQQRSSSSTKGKTATVAHSAIQRIGGAVKSVGKWIREHTSVAAHGAAAFGPGVEGNATKQLGSSPDSVSGHLVLGEGLYAGATADVNIVSWGSTESDGASGMASVDPSSYLHLKIGAVVSGGISVDLYPHGGSVTVSAGIGAGESAIVKPPVTLGGDIPIK